MAITKNEKLALKKKKLCAITSEEYWNLVHLDDVPEILPKYFMVEVIGQFKGKHEYTAKGGNHYDINEKQFKQEYYHPRHPLVASRIRRHTAYTPQKFYMQEHDKPNSKKNNSISWVRWGL